MNKEISLVLIGLIVVGFLMVILNLESETSEERIDILNECELFPSKCMEVNITWSIISYAPELKELINDKHN